MHAHTGGAIKNLLIVAGSARMMAQAARSAGLKPLIIDLFADLDTQACAEAFCQIPTLAEAHLAPALDELIGRYAVTHAIYGSGFEYYPESLSYLGSRLVILGNDPDTFIKLQVKRDFFSTLNRLNIPYPAVRFTAPDYGNRWLVKPMQGQGGVGIRHYRNNASDFSTPVYWQQYQAGIPHSVLFLADGQTVQIVGFNTQWSVSLSTDEEFVFSGIINSSELLDEHKRRIAGWLEMMVPVFGLKGLNSLDFIQSDDESYLLEINPRPSASMQLYDGDLLMQHIEATVEKASGNGVRHFRAAASRPTQAVYSGYQIVYAQRDLIIPDFFEWPDGCADLPQPGNMCRAGQPICSIIAHAKKTQHVLDQLLIQQQIIVNKFDKVDHPHGIYSQR